MLKVILVPELQNNYSFIGINTITKHAFIIDPATSDKVLSYCYEHNFKITHILNTHHHFDHIGGNKAIKLATKCQIIAAKNDANKIPDVDLKIVGDEELIINDFKLKVMSLPGHTMGHIGLYFAQENILFCGDVLFSGGCGRVFEGTAEMMYNSLQKIAALPPKTLIYCAHEYTLNNLKFALTIDPTNESLRNYFSKVEMLKIQNKPSIPTNLALELMINPFLRVDKLNIFTTNDLVKNWAIIRKLKNNF